MAIDSLNIFLYVMAVLPILIIFLPFSPMTIDWVNCSRDTQLKIYLNRRLLWSIGIVFFALLFGRWLTGDAEQVWLFITLFTIMTFVFMFWSAYVPFVMTPPSDPQVLSIEQADKIFKDDDAMLGLVQNGQARAYPRDAIARPHFYTDKVGNQSVVISYCILCNSSIAFKSELNGQPLNLSCITAHNNNIIYKDLGTGNFIQQLDGKVIYGPDKDTRLESLPVTMSSWKAWKHLHPDTTLYYAPAKTLRDKIVTLMISIMIPIDKLSKRHKPWHRLQGELDKRLPAMSFVFGVEIDGEYTAYPVSFLQENPVFSDHVGGKPIVVFYDKKRELGAIFSRSIGEEVLEFSGQQDPSSAEFLAKDDSGTEWNLKGLGKGGSFDGQSLSSIPHYNKIFWFSWTLFKGDKNIRIAT